MDNYLGGHIEKNDNQSIREWYVSNVSDIPNRIDRSLSLEGQARQAFELRNLYKQQARAAMSDEVTAAKLNRVKPIPEWNELIENKMKRKSISRKEAVYDILISASRTNDIVNKEFGIHGGEQ